MILVELLSDEWTTLLNSTKKRLSTEFGAVSFSGGYCFHLALALFLQSKNCEIIADNGHAAVYDKVHDVSVDSAGVHQGESALRERPQRRWSSSDRFITAVKNGWASKKQVEDLQRVKEFYASV